MVEEKLANKFNKVFTEIKKRKEKIFLFMILRTEKKLDK